MWPDQDSENSKAKDSKVLRIDRLRLENYRCFREFEVDFHPHMTVLTAANGQGKTAILDALGLSLTPLLASFPEVFGNHIRTEDVYLDNQDNSVEPIYPCRVEVEGLLDGSRQTWARELRSYKGRTTTREAQALSHLSQDIAEHVKNRSQRAMPLIAHYGTERLWNTIKLTTGKKTANVTRSRLAGYLDCLNPASNFKWVQDWLGRTLMDFREAQESKDEGAARSMNLQMGWIVRTIKDFLRHVLPVESVRYSWKRGEIVLLSQGRPLSVGQLSDGTRIVLGLVADLAHRAIRLNPQLEDPMAETPGVVLVDEVDLHLHPQWQQQLVAQLRTTFPKLQFILTSHSPQVVSTVRREQVRIITHETTEASVPEAETYASRASSVLERVFSVDSRPPLEVVEELRHYLELVQRGSGNGPDGRELRSKLEEQLGGEDPDLVRADAMLARQKILGGSSA